MFLLYLNLSLFVLSSLMLLIGEAFYFFYYPIIFYITNIFLLIFLSKKSKKEKWYHSFLGGFSFVFNLLFSLFSLYLFFMFFIFEGTLFGGIVSENDFWKLLFISVIFLNSIVNLFYFFKKIIKTNFLALIFKKFSHKKRADKNTDLSSRNYDNASITHRENPFISSIFRYMRITFAILLSVYLYRNGVLFGYGILWGISLNYLILSTYFFVFNIKEGITLKISFRRGQNESLLTSVVLLLIGFSILGYFVFIGQDVRVGMVFLAAGVGIPQAVNIALCGLAKKILKEK